MSAAAALRALWAPGTDSATSTPSKLNREPCSLSSGSGTSNGVTGVAPASASSSGRSQTTAWVALARNARNVSSTSRRELYVVWWSSSALVRTAIRGVSLSSERSDSSASTTSHSPAPQPALEPVERTSPPTR